MITALRRARTLLAALVCAFTSHLHAQDETLLFNTSSAGTTNAISQWGMGVVGGISVMQSGMIYMGTNHINFINFPFTMRDGITNGQISAVSQAELSGQETVANLPGIKPWFFSSGTGDGVNSWYITGSNLVDPNRWAQCMIASQQYVNRPIQYASPFNEPDYGPWNQGSEQNLYDIMGLLQSSTNYSSTLMCGGTTLDVDAAEGWYDFVKGRAAVGTTHCLAGSVASYVNFMNDVNSSGGFALNPEMHDLVEAIIGAQYGLGGGIWWLSCNLSRGLFVTTSSSEPRLAYAEDDNNWSAAAVYRSTNNTALGFAGAAERQGLTTTFRYFAQDRDVWFDGNGPRRDYAMTIGEDGENFTKISWGPDVPQLINGKYLLVNRNSGKVMEVANGSTANGAIVQQNSFYNANWQKWDITPLGGGYYTMTAAHDGLYADMTGYSTVPGGLLQQYAGGGNQTEQWFFEYVGNGWYHIRGSYSGLYLEVVGGSQNIDVNIDQANNTGVTSQEWRLVPVGSWVTVDDTVSSASYTANWTTYDGNPGYDFTEHDCSTTGGKATFSFTGSQVRFYGFTGPNLGMANISVDGTVVASNVDCYSAIPAYNQLLFQSAMLSSASHALVVTVSGNKNTNSTGTEIVADAFGYFVGTTVNLTTPPATPTGLSATAGQVSVNLNWSPNTESDLAGYTVFRSTDSGGPYDTVATVTTNSFTDKAANQPEPYYYVVKAVDQSLNQSGYSAQVTASPGGGPALVAVYHLDGNVNDSSGNSNTATVNGMQTYASGVLGSALKFDGLTNSFEMPADMLNYTNFTIAAWVYWDGGAEWQRIFDFGTGTGQYMFLTPDSGSGTLRFAITTGGPGAEQWVQTASPMVSNQWVHVAITVNGSTVNLYTNGVVAATSSSITLNPAGFDPVLNYLGRSQFTGDPLFSGWMDEVYVANYAMSQSQIAALAVNPAPLPTLVHRYSFSETSGTIAHDTVGGSAWNGTLPNGGTFSGGKLSLAAANSQYVSLPSGILSNYNVVTIEAWVTFPDQIAWNTMFFSFGSTNGSEGYSYIFCAPQEGRIAITGTDYTGEQNAYSDIDFSFHTNLHVTAVFNPPANYLQLYTNGVLAGVNDSVTVPLSAVTNLFSYIGRSLYSGDAYFDFTIDEFRIYNGAMQPADIATAQLLGPNVLLSTNATLNLSTSAGALTMTWPTASSGFTLESSPTLGPSAIWTPVTLPPSIVGANNQVAVPLTNATMFFRLER